MIWTIARKELLANLLTLRLSVALVCVVPPRPLAILCQGVAKNIKQVGRVKMGV